jgi:predicted acetyltransferase
MTPRIRAYSANDRAQFTSLLAIAFRSGQPYDADVPFPGEEASAFVAEQDGKLAGGFRIRHMTVTCREALLRCGGISSVAVAPEYRQRGVGSAMMTWALAHMRARGWQVTALHAFRESYYRRFGWECAGRRVQITCPQWRFPRLTCGLPVQQLRLEDWAALEPAYRTFAMAYSGMALRKSLRLSRITTSSGNPALVYAVGEPIEAYAVLRLAPRTASNQEIAELVWATSAGYQALLATLSALCVNHDSLTWFEPGNGPFLSQWADRGIEATLLNPAMFRVLDVPSTLAMLPAAGSGTFTLAIDDEHLPDNHGPWRVVCTPEEVQVERSDTAEVRMHIRQYTQALLGEPSFADLVQHGLVSSTSARAVRDAAAFFSAWPTYTIEFF